MLVELHLLQNFAPANLNRDDTGAPKDCEFGGYRRARISSQCQKRAIRGAFRADGDLGATNLGQRTARLAEEVGRRLVQRGLDAETALGVARAGVLGLGLEFQNERPQLTEYLVFLGADELERLTSACMDQRPTLAEIAPATAGGKNTRRTNKPAFPKEVTNSLRDALDGRRAADVALFGRMLADVPDRNREAASQVAHAISTNRISAEFDFFTAVDDLKGPEEDAGAGMLGTVEFNSSCFYRYANVDLASLKKNLGNDEELARATVAAFLRAAITAIPTGKQNSFAAHNRPSAILAVARPGGACSLANAFVRPVRPSGSDGDLIGESIAAMDGYWGRQTAMYGDGGAHTWLCVDPEYASRLSALKERTTPSVEALLEAVMGAVAFDGTG